MKRLIVAVAGTCLITAAATAVGAGWYFGQERPEEGAGVGGVLHEHGRRGGGADGLRWLFEKVKSENHFSLDIACYNNYYARVPHGLQNELKQTKPFQSLEVEAMLSIARTAAMLEHGVAQALKPFGLTPTQYNVLRILRGAGTDGLCRNEVGARLIAPVPDVTRLLDRMEDTGLLTRERSSQDRRYVSTRITRKGLDLLDRLEAPIEALTREQMSHLGKRNLKVLVDVLRAAREKL